VLGLVFRDGVMDRIRLHERRYDEQAYLFVLASLEYCQAQLPERRHIAGTELALACRDLALERWGLMARVVLEHWGIRSTEDIGSIVFVLVDLGFLMAQPTDNIADFIEVFSFETAFELEYPWGAARCA
jgi:uncharacterized repeat protein (TIGR04138 family)